MYLFVRASGTGPNALADLLEDPGYREAQGVLEMISKSPSDLELYESRLKFLRDEQGKLEAARQEGREEGREEGERLGLEKGERLGLERGELVGQVRILQELLGDPVSPTLADMSLVELRAQLVDLQHRLRNRQS